MSKKTMLLIALGILLLVSAINFYIGTTITINGKHVTIVGGYMATYIGLVILAVALVILIPSVFILALVLSIVIVVFIMLFFPLMPIAFLLLPGIIFVGIVWLDYRMGETPSPADTSTALQPVPKQKLSKFFYILVRLG